MPYKTHNRYLLYMDMLISTEIPMLTRNNTGTGVRSMSETLLLH